MGENLKVNTLKGYDENYERQAKAVLNRAMESSEEGDVETLASVGNAILNSPRLATTTIQKKLKYTPAQNGELTTTQKDSLKNLATILKGSFGEKFFDNISEAQKKRLTYFLTSLVIEAKSGSKDKDTTVLKYLLGELGRSPIGKMGIDINKEYVQIDSYEDPENSGLFMGEELLLRYDRDAELKGGKLEPKFRLRLLKNKEYQSPNDYFRESLGIKDVKGGDWSAILLAEDENHYHYEESGDLLSTNALKSRHADTGYEFTNPFDKDGPKLIYSDNGKNKLEEDSKTRANKDTYARRKFHRDNLTCFFLRRFGEWEAAAATKIAKLNKNGQVTYIKKLEDIKKELKTKWADKKITVSDFKDPQNARLVQNMLSLIKDVLLVAEDTYPEINTPFIHFDQISYLYGSDKGAAAVSEKVLGSSAEDQKVLKSHYDKLYENNTSNAGVTFRKACEDIANDLNTGSLSIAEIRKNYNRVANHVAYIDLVAAERGKAAEEDVEVEAAKKNLIQLEMVITIKERVEENQKQIAALKRYVRSSGMAGNPPQEIKIWSNSTAASTATVYKLDDGRESGQLDSAIKSLENFNAQIKRDLEKGLPFYSVDDKGKITTSQEKIDLSKFMKKEIADQSSLKTQFGHAQKFFAQMEKFGGTIEAIKKNEALKDGKISNKDGARKAVEAARKILQDNILTGMPENSEMRSAIRDNVLGLKAPSVGDKENEISKDVKWESRYTTLINAITAVQPVEGSSENQGFVNVLMDVLYEVQQDYEAFLKAPAGTNNSASKRNDVLVKLVGVLDSISSNSTIAKLAKEIAGDAKKLKEEILSDQNFEPSKATSDKMADLIKKLFESAEAMKKELAKQGNTEDLLAFKTELLQNIRFKNSADKDTKPVNDEIDNRIKKLKGELAKALEESSANNTILGHAMSVANLVVLTYKQQTLQREFVDLKAKLDKAEKKDPLDKKEVQGIWKELKTKQVALRDNSEKIAELRRNKKTKGLYENGSSYGQDEKGTLVIINQALLGKENPNSLKYAPAYALPAATEEDIKAGTPRVRNEILENATPSAKLSELAGAVAIMPGHNHYVNQAEMFDRSMRQVQSEYNQAVQTTFETFFKETQKFNIKYPLVDKKEAWKQRSEILAKAKIELEKIKKEYETKMLTASKDWALKPGTSDADAKSQAEPYFSNIQRVYESYSEIFKKVDVVNQKEEKLTLQVYKNERNFFSQRSAAGKDYDEELEDDKEAWHTAVESKEVKQLTEDLLKSYKDLNNYVRSSQNEERNASTFFQLMRAIDLLKGQPTDPQALKTLKGSLEMLRSQVKDDESKKLIKAALDIYPGDDQLNNLEAAQAFAEKSQAAAIHINKTYGSNWEHRVLMSTAYDYLNNRAPKLILSGQLPFYVNVNFTSQAFKGTKGNNPLTGETSNNTKKPTFNSVSLEGGAYLDYDLKINFRANYASQTKHFDDSRTRPNEPFLTAEQIDATGKTVVKSDERISLGIDNIRDLSAAAGFEYQWNKDLKIIGEAEYRKLSFNLRARHSWNESHLVVKPGSPAVEGVATVAPVQGTPGGLPITNLTNVNASTPPFSLAHLTSTTVNIDLGTNGSYTKPDGSTVSNYNFNTNINPATNTSAPYTVTVSFFTNPGPTQQNITLPAANVTNAAGGVTLTNIFNGVNLNTLNTVGPNNMMKIIFTNTNPALGDPAAPTKFEFDYTVATTASPPLFITTLDATPAGTSTVQGTITTVTQGTPGTTGTVGRPGKDAVAATVIKTAEGVHYDEIYTVPIESNQFTLKLGAEWRIHRNYLAGMMLSGGKVGSNWHPMSAQSAGDSAILNAQRKAGWNAISSNSQDEYFNLLMAQDPVAAKALDKALRETTKTSFKGYVAKLREKGVSLKEDGFTVDNFWKALNLQAGVEFTKASNNYYSGIQLEVMAELALSSTVTFFANYSRYISAEKQVLQSQNVNLVKGTTPLTHGEFGIKWMFAERWSLIAGGFYRLGNALRDGKGFDSTNQNHRNEVYGPMVGVEFTPKALEDLLNAKVTVGGLIKLYATNKGGLNGGEGSVYFKVRR